MSKVTLIAYLRVNPGQEERFVREFEPVVEETRNEHGCINYDLHRSLEEPTLFLVHENWATREDLERHNTAPHIQAWLGQSEGVFAAPFELGLWEQIR